MNFDELELNPRKTKSIRKLGPVDIAELKAAVLALPEAVWDAENASKPNRFGSLDATRHIVFRFVASFYDWREAYDRPLWPPWQPLLEPVLNAASAQYGYARGAFTRIMLARMARGGEIHVHRDTNPAAKWPHKVHLPLLTNPDVTFFVDGHDYHFPEGEAVEVNNMGPHAVKNAGHTDRIHLIFEYYDLDQPNPAWVDDLPRQMAAQSR
jgi:Aspartyl/Asparaginyl beta-hydroxylase